MKKKFKPNLALSKIILTAFLELTLVLTMPSCNKSSAPVATDNPTGKVDLILYNGNVHTMDDHRSITSALAISGKHILAVGSNEKILVMKDASTKVIDLKGRMVLPGIIDSHVHLGMWPDYATACQLKNASSQDDVLEMMKKWDKEHPGTDLIWGFGYSPCLISFNMTKKELDKLFPNRPVVLVGIQHDRNFANSKALEYIHFGDKKGDATDPLFTRDQDGKPTGEFTGDWGVMRFNLFKTDLDELPDYAEVLEKEVRRLNTLGITSFFDAGMFLTFQDARMDKFKELDQSGRLTARVDLSYIVSPDYPIYFQVLWHQLMRNSHRSEHVRANTLKIFCDFTDRYMVEPFYNEPLYNSLHNGPAEFPKDKMVTVMKAAQQMDWRVMAHVLGDESVRDFLDVVEEYNIRTKPGAPRHTLTHLYNIHPKDLPRFKTLGIAADVQTAWAYDKSFNGIDSEIERKMFGEERARRHLCFGDMYRSGMLMTASSDHPYGFENPFDTIEVGIIRRNPNEAMAIKPYHIEQALDMDTMLTMFTINNADVLGMKDIIGSLEAGKMADVIVIDQDLYKIAPEKISDTKVLLTIFEGKIVHQSMK